MRARESGRKYHFAFSESILHVARDERRLLHCWPLRKDGEKETEKRRKRIGERERKSLINKDFKGRYRTDTMN